MYNSRSKKQHLLVLNSKEKLLMTCHLCHFHVVTVKTYGRNAIHWNSQPNYLAALLVSYWFTGWTLDFYLSVFWVQYVYQNC
jgi:hypothetical protein